MRTRALAALGLAVALWLPLAPPAHAEEGATGFDPVPPPGVLTGTAATLDFSWRDADGTPTVYLDGFDIAEEGSGTVRRTGADRYRVTFDSTFYSSGRTSVVARRPGGASPRIRTDVDVDNDRGLVTLAPGGVRGSGHTVFASVQYTTSAVKPVRAVFSVSVPGAGVREVVDTEAPFAAEIDTTGLPESRHSVMEVAVVDNRGMVSRQSGFLFPDNVPRMTLAVPSSPHRERTFVVTATGGEDSSEPPVYRAQPVLWVQGVRSSVVPRALGGDRWEWTAEVTSRFSHTVVVGVGDERKPLVTTSFGYEQPAEQLRVSVPQRPVPVGSLTTVFARASAFEQVTLVGVRTDGRTVVLSAYGDAQGLVRFSFRPTASLSLVAVPHGAQRTHPRASVPVALPVLASTTLTATQARPGAPVVFTGRLLPCVGSRVLSVHRLTPTGGKVLVGRFRPVCSGGRVDFRASKTFSGRGTFRFTVTVHRDAWSEAATSRPATVTIR